MDRLTVDNAAHAFERQDAPDVELFRHGTMTIEYYRPQGEDHQHPHSRDELYVIISGHGTFLRDGVKTPFEPGEILFVPAGAEHRFISFSDDFATWVVFYGPDGGEVA